MVLPHKETSMVMRAAIYARVSGKGQEDKYSLPEQVDLGTKYCERLGYQIAVVHREVHTGFELDQRPEMTRLREAVRRGEIDVIVAVELDRIARNQVHQSV